MTNTTATKLFAITVAYKDGAFHTKPEASIEAGLLGGMVQAQSWATVKNLGSIAWTEITDRGVKGHFPNGERIAVYFADLPMAAEDQITDWLV